MTKDEINKLMEQLDKKSQDIHVEMEKLERQKSIIEAADVIKALPLFDYEFCVNALQIYEKKGKERDGWKALDGAWNRGYHAQIFLDENIMLRCDDNDYRIQVQQADYRGMKADGYETSMKILAEFSKKYNLNVTYGRHERAIQRLAEEMKNKREEMLCFKRAMGE